MLIVPVVRSAPGIVTEAVPSVGSSVAEPSDAPPVMEKLTEPEVTGVVPFTSVAVSTAELPAKSDVGFVATVIVTPVAVPLRYIVCTEPVEASELSVVVAVPV